MRAAYLLLGAVVAIVHHVSSGPVEHRIIGGWRADILQHPYIVAIFRLKQTGWTLYCTGSIISTNAIITSATCVVLVNEKYIVQPTDIVVIAGDDSFPSDGTGTGVEIPIETIIKHPSYASALIYVDNIAILRPIAKITMGLRIQPIPLATAMPTSTFTILKVAGWGYKANDGKIADHLREAVVPLMTTDDCKNSMPVPITDHNVCVGAPGIGPCVGDGGGPLIMYDGADHAQLLGIFSGNLGCFVKAIALYTIVPSKYITDFIVANMN